MLLKNDIDNIKRIVNNNVLTEKEELYCYAEDSTNSETIAVSPDAVVFVETISQVQEIIKYANKNKIPVISRGAGTNMVGACTCPEGGIVLNFSRMNKILKFSPIDMTMTVQPGAILADIKKAAEAEGLFYPPDPSNYRVSTIGGSIAQSSGGAMGFKYGTTKDYILSLTVVLADGTLVKLGKGTIKDAAGYHLNQLIIGSEGTLAVVVEAELKLIPRPEALRTIMGYFDSLEAAVDGVNNIIKNKIFPATIDFMDNNSITTVERFYPCGLHTDKSAMLIVNIDGFECSMNYQQECVIAALKEAGVSDIEIAKTEEEIEAVWTARRSSFAAAAKLAPDVLSDDIIVPRSAISTMVKGCKDICDKYNLAVCMVGHLGDGNIHPQIALNLENDEEVKRYFKAKSEIYALAVSLGGTISAEHGVGIEKLAYLAISAGGTAVDYMKKVKEVFDPNKILNPGKIFKS